MCVLLDGSTLASVCMSAGKLGLVVITCERYFMIVHAVAYRKHYRKWMTSIGAALPWISGVCAFNTTSRNNTKNINYRYFTFLLPLVLNTGPRSSAE